MSFLTPLSKLFASFLHQNIGRNIHLAGVLCLQTHYDTLKLTPSCTLKDIREAFIKLSKQCHPDRNQSDPKNHARFVKLNEAYSILSRPDKRKAYDESLMFARPQQQYSPHTYPNYARVHPDITNWDAEGNQSSNSHSSENYYGIRGVKRVSNATIALICIAVASIGVILQVVAIRVSMTFSRKHLDVKSAETGEILAKVREDAQRHGKERQLELLRERVIRSGVDVPPFDFGKGSSATVDTLDDRVKPGGAKAAEGMAEMHTGVDATLLTSNTADMENVLRV